MKLDISNFLIAPNDRSPSCQHNKSSHGFSEVEAFDYFRDEKAIQD